MFGGSREQRVASEEGARQRGGLAVPIVEIRQGWDGV